ncbi:MAG: VOC family protein [Candidatus Eisenbacteria bacterium]|nr:VOC family protein [Candidatus Eisenbacteria bacterium]
MPATKTQSFFWYELMTTDRNAAYAFYRKIVGWEGKDFGGGGTPYTVLSVGASGIGGMMDLSPEMCGAGLRPCWMGYISVDDVDACVARIVAAGGKIHRAPADIPGVGRFAVVADPHGAGFMLLKGSSPEGYTPPAPGARGTIGWHELHAGDGIPAFEFYSSLFGWTKAEDMDMGPLGVYRLFAAGDAPIGGIMTKMKESPMPFWLFYFNVDAIDAATALVKENGGQVMNGPMEVPTGQWIVQCLDPQGAMFALVAPGR